MELIRYNLVSIRLLLLLLLLAFVSLFDISETFLCSMSVLLDAVQLLMLFVGT
jgi:hypothetical protein